MTTATAAGVEPPVSGALPAPRVRRALRALQVLQGPAAAVEVQGRAALEALRAPPARRALQVRQGQRAPRAQRALVPTLAMLV